eukprot:1159135-Pelagomonas_calceolata.AAC.2
MTQIIYAKNLLPTATELMLQCCQLPRSGAQHIQASRYKNKAQDHGLHQAAGPGTAHTSHLRVALAAAITMSPLSIAQALVVYRQALLLTEGVAITVAVHELVGQPFERSTCQHNAYIGTFAAAEPPKVTAYGLQRQKAFIQNV